jgi:hypothetical protein
MIMSLLICPECGTENLADAEFCSACQALLVEASPVEPGKPGQSDQDERELLPQADEDLPGLLHSLKQDDDLEDFPVGEGETRSPSPLDIGTSENQDETGDEPDLPEWLYRVRNRAQTEADSVGEVTQRIRAARESLDEAQQESKHRQLESVIQKIHGEDEEQSSSDGPVEEAQSDVTDEGDAEDTDWLSRIRKKHRPEGAEEPEEKLTEREGDSLLQWLVALEDEETGSGGLNPEEKPQIDVPSEDTQEVDVSPKPGESTQEIPVRGSKSPAPTLTVSREDQVRADQLAATIIDERAPRAIRLRQRGFSPRGIRLVMGLLLVAVLSFALYLPAPVEVPPALQGPHSLAVLDWTQSLPVEASILLILDYQPGYSVEMNLISKPILENLFVDGREMAILASAPSGSLLFARLVDESGFTDRMDVRDLGYFPVESFGAYGLANHILSEWQIPTQPAFAKTLPSGPVDGILILGDDYEGAMAWIEQLSSLVPETPIYLLVTAQAAPLLMPYWESGQVSGIVAGMPDAVNLADETASLTSRWRAYQAGILLVIVVLLIGLNFPMHQPGAEDERKGKAYE